MAQGSTELFSPTNRTASVEDLTFTIDFYRCGKCDKEYDLLEDFIFHKIISEKNSMVLWESEKITGIQIPRFTDTGMNIYLTQDTQEDFNHSSTGTVLQQSNKLSTVHDNIDMEYEHESPPLLDIPASREQNRESEKNNVKQRKHLKSDFPSVPLELRCQNPSLNKPECEICGNTYRDVTTLKTHIATVHSESRPYSCEYKNCTCSFKTKASLQRHVRRHTGERPFSCPDCGRLFRESGTLARHMKARVPCMNKKDEDLPRYGKCASLLEQNKNESEDMLEEEEETEHTSPPETIQIVITCSQTPPELPPPGTSEQIRIECNKEITAVEENAPVSESHGDVSAYPDFAQLLEVATRVRSVPQVEEEEVTVTPPAAESEPVSELLDPTHVKKLLSEQIQEQNIHCLACEQQFQQLAQLSQHLQAHLEEYNFRCSKCYFVSKHKNSLLIHTKNVHNRNLSLPLHSLSEVDENKWAQEIVVQLLTLHDILDEQEQGDKPSPGKRNNGSNRCHVCLKKFQGKFYLSLHMGTHTGEKPYSCNICSCSFICKDSLQKHIITHSSDRSYKCSVCNKLFKRASHIREHLKIHSEDKPFSCNICNRGFRWQGTLKAHELTHIRDAQFTCETCGRRFRARSSLIRHTRRHNTLSSRLSEQQTIQESVASANAASCEDESGLQLSAASAHDVTQDHQAYLLILDDGSLMIQDAANMW